MFVAELHNVELQRFQRKHAGVHRIRRLLHGRDGIWALDPSGGHERPCNVARAGQAVSTVTVLSPPAFSLIV